MNWHPSVDTGLVFFLLSFQSKAFPEIHIHSRPDFLGNFHRVFNSSACRTLDQLHRFQQQLLARHTAKLSWNKHPVVALQIHRRTKQRLQFLHIMLTFRNFSKFFSEFLFLPFSNLFLYFSFLRLIFVFSFLFLFYIFSMLEISRQKKRPEKFRPALKINEERKVFNRQKVVSKIKTCFVQPSGLTPHFVLVTSAKRELSK